MILQPWCEKLLKHPVTKYLVSAGPCYYVRQLGAKFNIPDSNILCSNYSFTSEGKLSQCDAVSAAIKQSFVKEMSVKHDIAIGVGDNLAGDAFIHNCDIPILRGESQGLLSASSLDTVLTLVKKLSRKTPIARTTPTVFIGSSTEQSHIADAIYVNLERKGYRPTHWNHGVFQPSTHYIESLEEALAEYDFAVFVMAPDDRLETRETEYSVVRDNITFELGLFMGRLGRGRCFLLHPRSIRSRLPSDLDGIVMLEYDSERVAQSMAEAERALSGCAIRIKEEIDKLGCRHPRI